MGEVVTSRAFFSFSFLNARTAYPENHGLTLNNLYIFVILQIFRYFYPFMVCLASSLQCSVHYCSHASVSSQFLFFLNNPLPECTFFDIISVLNNELNTVVQNIFLSDIAFLTVCEQ